MTEPSDAPRPRKRYHSAGEGRRRLMEVSRTVTTPSRTRFLARLVGTFLVIVSLAMLVQKPGLAPATTAVIERRQISINPRSLPNSTGPPNTALASASIDSARWSDGKWVSTSRATAAALAARPASPPVE